MSAPKQPPAANETPPPDRQVALALEAARQQIAAASATPELRHDALGVFLAAISAAINAIGALYRGVSDSASAIAARAETQQREITAAMIVQREKFTKDLELTHTMAINKLKAEEIAKQAEIKAGLVQAANGALQDMLRADRRNRLPRSLAIGVVAAAILLAAGGVVGWEINGVMAVKTVASDLNAVTAVANATKANAAALNLITERVSYGMTSEQLLTLSNLNEIIGVGVVGRVAEDEVPPPCVAAVPEGAIRTIDGKPVTACVIALNGNKVKIHGGAFLTRMLAGGSAAQ
jgi:hypothetical protein